MSSPQITAVIGTQWGDEGKGKLVDYLATDNDVCARYNGGANAGHTIYLNGKKHVFHLLPCGMLYKDKMNLLGHGVVVHLKSLKEELIQLEKSNPKAREQLLISSRAHILFDLHMVIDTLNETNPSLNTIGTTRRGIGPCYVSKMSRKGIRIADLLDWSNFQSKFQNLWTVYKKLYNLEDYDGQKELEEHKELLEFFRPNVVDGICWINKQIRENKKILIEGANAMHLDIDFGTYPYVTSSSVAVGGILNGLGIATRYLQNIIGVVKAYTTRVGNGPFPTELHDSVYDILIKEGKEYGATTKRSRRCGWLDLVLVNYTSLICGLTSINLTKLDILTGLKEIKICTYYKHKTKGLLQPYELPVTDAEYKMIEPIYESFSGWTENISSCESFESFPENAQKYVLFIERFLNVPIKWIGIGQNRTALILR